MQVTELRYLLTLKLFGFLCKDEMPRYLAKLAEALSMNNEIINHNAVRKGLYLQEKKKDDAMPNLTLGQTGRLKLWK
jgi:hypothetical protein